jgi:hypothetical protein
MHTDMDTGDRPAQLPPDCSNSHSSRCSSSCTSSSSNEEGAKVMAEEQAAPLKTDSYSTCTVNITYCSSNSCSCSRSCTSSTSEEDGSKAMEEEQAAPLQPDSYSTSSFNNNNTYLSSNSRSRYMHVNPHAFTTSPAPMSDTVPIPPGLLPCTLSDYLTLTTDLVRRGIG